MGLARAPVCTLVIWTAGVELVPRARATDAIVIPAAAIEMARVPAASFELMQRELDMLLEGAGLRVRWRRASPASETAADELRIVFLDGPGRGLHADRPVLAASRHAEPGPTIWVYTPTVLAARGAAGGAA